MSNIKDPLYGDGPPAPKKERKPILGKDEPTGSASWCYVAGCGDEYVSA